jgi:hypothetical protein
MSPFFEVMSICSRGSARGTHGFFVPWNYKFADMVQKEREEFMLTELMLAILWILFTIQLFVINLCWRCFESCSRCNCLSSIYVGDVLNPVHDTTLCHQFMLAMFRILFTIQLLVINLCWRCFESCSRNNCLSSICPLIITAICRTCVDIVIVILLICFLSYLECE